MQKIYLDNAATTKVRKEVVSEMQKYMLEEYGNPSSQHELGIKAREAIDSARTKIVREIDAKLGEIYFTSGGTESNNLAIIGLAKANPGKKTIIISSIEHPSIVEPCKYLEDQGYKIIKIRVNKEGIIDIDELEKLIKTNSDDLLLVSIMQVNNIIGTIQPVEEIVNLCKEKRVLFHTDAVQSFGKLKIDVKKMNIDLLSASGHKINGPKGVGFLYIRAGIKINPLVYGGGQEKGLRNGTENVPGIVGMARALELQKKINKEKIRKVRDLLINELENIGGKINGSKKMRIYNNINVSFPVDAGNLVAYLSNKGIYVSTGSACESKKEREDETLKAIGLNKKRMDGSIRITLNEEINVEDLDRIVREIEKMIRINLKIGLNIKD